MDVPSVLSIAGSDPSGGAGIQADLRVFSTLGVYGMAIPAALTVQNTRGVQQVFHPPVEILQAQIKAVLDDITPDAIKIGVLGDVKHVEAVANILSDYAGPIVLDPVVVSSSGMTLLNEEGLKAMADMLLPRCTLMTPNLEEWIVFKPLLKVSPPYVLITGGVNTGVVRDTFHGPEGTLCWEHTAIETKNTHGTGCSLSSSIAAHLALGLSPELACEQSIQFVRSALIRSKDRNLGHGKGGLLYGDEMCR